MRTDVLFLKYQKKAIKANSNMYDKDQVKVNILQIIITLYMHA